MSSVFYFVFIFAFMAVQDLSALLDHSKGRGSFKLSESHHDHMEHHWSKISEVKPNQLGAERINKHLELNGHDPINFTVATSADEELTLHHGPSSTMAAATPLGGALPSSVNNATHPCFPPIGDQGQLGSCVGWASTYYQASHELGLVNGYNNKQSFNNVLSPKWTYNLLNGGANNGLYIPDAYTLLQQNGATSIVHFPYDSNYLSWDLNTNDWVQAIYNRLSPPQLVSTQNLTAIKQLLNNGHIVTLGTYIDSWVFTQIKSDPANQNSPYTGQWAASWMNGEEGGHCITIVGYDDNVWIDVNGNGQVDSGERGAFLFANSWSTDWGNNGFIWVSYDAFLSKSGVPNGPNANRIPVAAATNNYVISVIPKATNYAPKLITEFTITQARRNQIKVAAGVSSTSVMNPTNQFSSDVLSNSGGSYEFDGTTSSNPETVTFAIDLTDLLGSGKQRFYLTLADTVAGNPTTLSAFSLIDMTHNQQVKYGGSLPLIVDNSRIAPYIDYNY